MHLVLLDFFIFLMITFFYLFNRKTATKADMYSKIAGVLKYAPDKIGAGGRGKAVDNEYC